jgi:hypothetical protein
MTHIGIQICCYYYNNDLLHAVSWWVINMVENVLLNFYYTYKCFCTVGVVKDGGSSFLNFLR